ncbi:hypothetical protein D9757_013627 [Collybiopsis confluens]|uniref:Uncharacterized protein n=1 Tax=Collybiopsis confluens TaxID=2823264 RepID=A0A8H5FVK7_9AGAR|nr:hypothetical protein D9757_013627 [Collybiopsis confluens]
MFPVEPERSEDRGASRNVESFSHSSRVTIQDEATINTIGRDQIITNNIYYSFRQAHDTREEDGDEDEYDYIKRGHIRAIKELGRDIWSEHRGNGEWVVTASRHYHTALIHGTKTKWTMFTYHGPGAHVKWKQDFLQYAHSNLSPNTWQLFGINKSTVPALLFHSELLPAAYVLFKGPDFWMSLYVGLFRESVFNIWFDTDRNCLCDGPMLKHDWSNDYTNYLMPGFRKWGDKKIQLSPNLNVIKQTSSAKSFAQLHQSGFHLLDILVLNVAMGLAKQYWIYPNQSEGESRRKFRFDTIYSGSRNPEPLVRLPASTMRFRWYSEECIAQDIQGKLTRVNFRGAQYTGRGQAVIYLNSPGVIPLDQTSWMIWLSQSSRVFDRLNIPMHDRDELFILPYPVVYFFLEEGTIPDSVCIDESSQSAPVFLFIHNIPANVEYSEDTLATWAQEKSYYWSCDKNGKTPIPKDQWKTLGLPFPNVSSSGFLGHTASSYIYSALQEWQIARGFDPGTDEYAKSLGPGYEKEVEMLAEPMKSRFGELDGEKWNGKEEDEEGMTRCILSICQN